MTAPDHLIRIAGGDVCFPCAPEDTLLRAAQRAGLGFPYECNVGSCGNCKFELAEGEVQMQWAQAPGWTEKDRQRKRFLGCQSRPLADCTVKLRLDDRYVPRHRPQRIPAVLEAHRVITHDISEFRFRLDRPQIFEPGQYALAYLPGVAGGRAYSMSNTAGDGRVWEFQVRRMPGGQGSAMLFDGVPPGQCIEIDGPYGMAWLRRDAPRDILCLAGGSGLAPMISIARGAMAEPRLAQRQLHFLYGGRTAADICGEDMLRELPGWGERLSYHAAISSVPDGGGPAWSGSVGYLHQIAQQRFGARLTQMEIYFAGPPVMATAVQRMLIEAKVPFEQVHFDQFY
nr:2Fe-2S iron-sulfur cluster-binding protein [Rhodoferax sp.]